ncbi:MAG: hypothetical protein ACTHOF_18395 [Flavisolibacter sp.]|jgi:hypothetical protein
MRQFLFAIIFFLTACNNQTQSQQKASVDTLQTVAQTHDTDIAQNIWVDKFNGQPYPLPDSMGGKPAFFYLDNPNVASIAKALYTGQFRPTDNDSTTQLLSYVTTNDSSIRPFYRWCLDFTIQISDGALAEYPGEPALKYATKFPKEFFAYMDKEKSGQRYKQWTEIIAYSGLDNYEDKPDKIQKQITTKIFANCQTCNDSVRQRIAKFAKDITDAIKLQD